MSCSVMDNITADSWIADPDGHLKSIQTNWDKVPELGVTGVHLLKDGQLVRFRGMIQDMADPVIYLSQYEILNETTGVKELRCGKYRDVYLPCKDDELILDDTENCKNGDRRAYYCVSIPGLNQWTLEYGSSKSETDITMNECAAETSHTCMKRSADDMDTDSADKKIASPPLENCKRTSCNAIPSETTEQINLNFPIEEQDNYSCVVNLYDGEDGCIRLNEVIDVVGFVSFCCGTDELDHLPPSLVPRLHAVHFKKVLSSNPHFNSSLDHSDIINGAEKIRSDLLLALTQLMLGDSLAAEYLLCNLISRIYKRQDVITLGKFCVNISNVPTDAGNYPEEIYNVIKKLVPKSHYLPLSLEKMNLKKFIPVKDYENNRLKSGVLQLSDSTHLILDETKLQTGKLVDNGVHNVKALENLISFQKLKCDFKFNHIEYPVDLPVIVISEGKSILSHDVRVVLKTDSSFTHSLDETYAAVNEYLKEPLLTDIRRYLTVVSHQEFDLTESLIGTIQEDYVKLRQTEKSTSEFDLHTLLVLSRLLCLSCGQTSLTKEMWDKAFSMENERKSRVREISSSQRDN